jgi:hypothetical protein
MSPIGFGISKGNSISPNTTATNGLVLFLDGKNYPGSGTTWNDSSGSFSTTVVGNVEGVGQQQYVSAGTFSFTVPAGATTISAVCIGGGGGGAGGDGGRGTTNNGGGGGGLCYGRIPVTAGETLTVVVGAGGASNSGADGNAGGNTTISRGANTIMSALGGAGGLERNGQVAGPQSAAGGNYILAGDVVGGGSAGGAGGAGNNSVSGGTGGGGAGGYIAAGGAGGVYNGAGSSSTGARGVAGDGGGGGAGYIGTTAGTIGGGGGGTGILGAGSQGTGGTGSTGAGGGGGSGGTNGFTSSVNGGGNYGGGGGGRADSSGLGGVGSQGAVRIIWGVGRSYPSTLVANQTTVIGTTGTTTNASNTATLINGPTYNSSNSIKSFIFDGTNDAIKIPVSASLKTTNFTFEMWVRCTAASGNQIFFSSHYSANGIPSGIMCGISSDVAFTGGVRRYYFATYFNGSFYSVDNIDPGPYTNLWINIAGTWNGSAKVLYFNGNISATQVPGGTSFSQLNDFYLGNNADQIANNIYTNSVLSGNIASFKFYNRALTAAEIKRNYNAASGRYL